jgi:hypothetical protein
MESKMGKQIGVTISDEMYAKYQKVKEDFGVHEAGKKTMSEVCREAIRIALKEAEAHYLYRQAGIQDGRKICKNFSDADKKYIDRILSKTGPYKKWSRFDRIEEVKNHFEETHRRDLDSLYPQFTDIMDGITPVLHDWIDDADKKSEVCWSYCAGCYEGVRFAYLENKETAGSKSI